MSARIFVAGEIVAWIFLAVALCFVALWAFDRGNDLRHEYLIGAGMAWLYGSPFWLGAPALAAWSGVEYASATIQSMNTTSLQQAVLHLPKQDRAHLVHLLLDSLDEPSEVQVQSLWLQESQRRAAEIDQGKVRLVTAEELEKQVQTLFK